MAGRHGGTRAGRGGGRKRSAALLAGALLAAGLPAPAGASDGIIRYSRDRGGACSVMIPYYGPAALWIGRFSYGRDLDVSSDRVFTDWRTQDTCFFTLADCERWLQRLGTVFTIPPGHSYCMPLAEALRPAGKAVVKP